MKFNGPLLAGGGDWANKQLATRRKPMRQQRAFTGAKLKFIWFARNIFWWWEVLHSGSGGSPNRHPRHKTSSLAKIRQLARATCSVAIEVNRRYLRDRCDDAYSEEG
jgi:hypothetical protein